MSEYIEKAKVLKIVNDMTECEDDYERITEWVHNMPSIDIVRCKECKHGTYCKEAEMYICNANDQDLYEADHFCSYGERENNE